MLVKATQNRIRKLGLKAIRLNAGTQTRAHIDDATVAEYAEAMERGDRFPPVVVFQNNGDFIMADGFHRFRAASRARLTHLYAEIRQGTRRDALKFALAANHKHGLRRTNADKRHAVRMALAEFGNLSDRLLAEMCCVSQPFVGNVRQQLITDFSSTPRLGKDGKLRSRRTTNGEPARARQDVERQGRPDNVLGNRAFMKVAELLAGLQETVEALARRYPNKTDAMLAAVRKLRSDLLQLENHLRGFKLR